jgi:Ran GTPase-activating protein (RanGAP) involved in mRNA processing and transport
MIRFDRNMIGDGGAVALAKALQDTTSLQHIYLNGNKIGYDGATALAKTLQVNASLQKLYMNRNNISDDGRSSRVGKGVAVQ